MTEYKTRVTKIILCPAGEPIYGDEVIEIEICDESGGEFVEVRQISADGGKIAINPEEWPALRAAIDHMVSECEGGQAARP